MERENVRKCAMVVSNRCGNVVTQGSVQCQLLDSHMTRSVGFFECKRSIGWTETENATATEIQLVNDWLLYLLPGDEPMNLRQPRKIIPYVWALQYLATAVLRFPLSRIKPTAIPGTSTAKHF